MEIQVTKTLAVLVMLGASLVTGCGGDEGQKSTAGSKTPESSTSSPAAEPDPVDQAIAESALLTLGDFPAGWEAKPADEDDAEDDESQHRIADCLGVAYEDFYDGDSGASADSKDFANENDDEIFNSVSVGADESRMKARFAIAATEKYRECTLEELRTVMKEAAAEEGDFEVGEASLNEISFDKFGDESTAFRVTIPVEAEGMSLDVTLDLVLVRVGRAVTTVTAQSLLTSIDAAELSEYVKIATDRLASELA